MTDHKKDIISKRRKNNIFGEVQDHVLIPLLDMGCVAGFYNPNESLSHPITIYARSDCMYAVKVLYQETPDMVVSIDKYKEALVTAAAAIDAVPIYAIHRPYCTKTKFYSINGKRLHTV